MPAHKLVTFGEVMLRLSTPGNARIIQCNSFDATYGGGEANVSVAVAQMGMRAEHVTRFPDNEVGYSATRLMRSCGVETHNINYGGPRMGIYFLEVGAAMRPSKVVYDRAGSSFAHLETSHFNWEQILAGATWFHFTGITPAISQAAADACLEAVRTARRMGLTVSADINYRKNLWQYGKTPQQVMPALVEGVDVLFASKKDMEEMLGTVQVDEGDKFANVARQVMDKFPQVKKVVNTKRGSVSANHNTLSATLFDGQQLLKTQTLDINPIVDRIGGGDAFCAGFIFGSCHYGNDQQALECGLAASVLKHTVLGDANLVTLAEVEAVMRGETTGKLSR